MGEEELEQALTGDRFRTAHPDTQIDIVSMFLSYLDESEINASHHYVLNHFFLDWVTTDDPHYATPKDIARVVKAAEDYEEGDGEVEASSLDYLNQTESDFLLRLGAYDPCCLLAAMQTIYAFLTPDTSVKPPALPGRNRPAKKRAKEATKPASGGKKR